MSAPIFSWLFLVLLIGVDGLRPKSVNLPATRASDGAFVVTFPAHARFFGANPSCSVSGFASYSGPAFLRVRRDTSKCAASVLSMNTGGSILEKSKTVSPAPASQSDSKKDKEKQFHVLLFNDPINTREYVCSILVQVFGHTRGEAYNIMQQAHSQGFAICNTTGKDEADSQCAALKTARLTSSVIEAD